MKVLLLYFHELERVLRVFHIFLKEFIYSQKINLKTGRSFLEAINRKDILKKIENLIKRRSKISYLRNHYFANKSLIIHSNLPNFNRRLPEIFPVIYLDQRKTASQQLFSSLELCGTPRCSSNSNKTKSPPLPVAVAMPSVEQMGLDLCIPRVSFAGG